MYRLKNDKYLSTLEVFACQYLAVRARDVLAAFSGLDTRFAGAILVPVPRHAPLSKANAIWPADRLARALVAAGLGQSVRRLLARKIPLPKSALQAPRERPSLEQHLESLEVAELVPDSPLILVDDVVTRGSTLLTAAMTLATVKPELEISAFAAMRTLGKVPEIPSLLDPCQGRIWLDQGKVRREP